MLNELLRKVCLEFLLLLFFIKIIIILVIEVILYVLVGMFKGLYFIKIYISV